MTYYRRGREIYRRHAARDVRIATARTMTGAALAVRALNYVHADWRVYL